MDGDSSMTTPLIRDKDGAIHGIDWLNVVAEILARPANDITEDAA
jgi:hypothetical protein